MLIAALCLSAQVYAAPRPRHMRPRPHVRRFRVHHLPWQTIVAGGLTAGGVVFAYKVSDGIQKGTVEAARSAPDRFIGRCSGVSGTMQAACAVCVLIAIGYLAWRVGVRQKAKTDESATGDRSHDGGGQGG